MLAFILGVVIIVIGLAVSIGLHEIGHLVPAKLFGVKVTQYMIGFGPTLWSRRRGETEYGVKAIPLGGYIAMIGMFPPAKGERVAGVEHGLLPRPRAGRPRLEHGVDHAGRRAPRVLPAARVEAHHHHVRRAVHEPRARGGALRRAADGLRRVQPSTTVGSVSACALPATSERQTCEPGDPAAPGAAAGIEPGDRIVSVAASPSTRGTSRPRSSATTRRADRLVVVRDGEEVTSRSRRC